MIACWRRCLVWVSLACLVVVGGATALLALASTWLIASDSPAPADAIVVLAGDVRRARHAADLYRDGYGTEVLISRPERERWEQMLDGMGIPFPLAEDLNAEVLKRAGVPERAIGFFGEHSLSTFDEALALRKRYAGRVPTLLVVTSPYHVRRAKLVLGRNFPNARVLVVATPYEDFPARWWTSQEAARAVLLETAKFGYYLVGGRFAAAADD